MTERDTDFEFDFFDEPDTHEAAEPNRQRTVRRGGSRPPLRPPTGVTPLLRLVVAVALGIVVVVLLVFWVQSCQSENKENSYRDYVRDLTGVANRSAGAGRQLTRILTSPGIKQTDLQRRMRGLVAQERQHLNRAQELSPPGPLREAHEHAVEALQFRVSGLSGLRDAFARARPRDADRAGALLANQARRFVASDVVWDDRVKDPAKDVLADEGIGGVVVPDSNFLANPDLASSTALAQLWRRLRGAATGGTPTGLRGTALVSVRVLPGGQTLSTTEENVVEATPELAFQVTVEDSGNAQEVQVPVILRIQTSAGPPIVRRQTIDVINPNQQKTVTFSNIRIRPEDFASPRTLRVAVTPVPGEARRENNSATYTVTFSLP